MDTYKSTLILVFLPILPRQSAILPQLLFFFKPLVLEVFASNEKAFAKVASIHTQ